MSCLVHLFAELDTRRIHWYILDTFPIVRRKDAERWGEYRTKRMVLEAFESLKH